MQAFFVFSTALSLRACEAIYFVYILFCFEIEIPYSTLLRIGMTHTMPFRPKEKSLYFKTKEQIHILRGILTQKIKIATSFLLAMTVLHYLCYMETIIRPATQNDLTAILEIVNYNILNTTAVYDYYPKTIEDMQQWLAERQQAGWPVIIAEEKGSLLGYASYGTFRIKAAYQFTVEHSVYVSHEHAGKGVGKLLLSKLIELAKQQELHSMIGCIDADNKSSIDFHKKFGFTEAGVLREVGFKFNRWLDLQFMELLLK